MIAWSAFASAPAHAVPYTSDSATVTAIGDQIGSSFDILNAGAVSGSINGSGPYLLNDLTFTVGPNCNTCIPSAGSFLENLTINGETEALTISFNWVSGLTTDTLTI
ncbi:MAG TPA: hypothetical protein VGO07_00305, partial [Candidatus Saccharimonadales bacterium]|nr:hypothetical protein [Candidatus Saccharimonadales bacterium]